jgi:hypothetical protein
MTDEMEIILEEHDHGLIDVMPRHFLGMTEETPWKPQ